jgi:hypothetical protein
MRPAYRRYALRRFLPPDGLSLCPSQLDEEGQRRDDYDYD